jgi:hypothetical protein
MTTLRLLQLVALVGRLFMVATVLLEVCLTTAGLDPLNRLRHHKPLEEAALSVALMMLLVVDPTKLSNSTGPNKATNKVLVTT